MSDAACSVPGNDSETPVTPVVPESMTSGMCDQFRALPAGGAVGGDITPPAGALPPFVTESLERRAGANYGRDEPEEVKPWTGKSK
jgi:hypothetical protein